MGPSESRKTLKSDMLAKDPLLLSAKRRIPPHPQHVKPDQALPSPETRLWSRISYLCVPGLCAWHTYLTDLSPEPPKVYISSIWDMAIGSWVSRSFQFSVGGSGWDKRDDLRAVPNSSPCVSSAGHLSHRNKAIRTSRILREGRKTKGEIAPLPFTCGFMYKTGRKTTHLSASVWSLTRPPGRDSLSPPRPPFSGHTISPNSSVLWRFLCVFYLV